MAVETRRRPEISMPEELTVIVDKVQEVSSGNINVFQISPDNLRDRPFWFDTFDNTLRTPFLYAGRPRVMLDIDNIGLAKDSTLSSPLPRVITTGRVEVTNIASGIDIGSVNGIVQTPGNWTEIFINIQNALLAPIAATTLSTIPLPANATFTSFTMDFSSSRAGYLCALAFSDQVGDSFRIEQSIDGINWDLKSAEVTTPPPGEGIGIKAAIVARFVRVVYTNGPTAQTVFRLGVRATIA